MSYMILNSNIGFVRWNHLKIKFILHSSLINIDYLMTNHLTHIIE